MKLALITDDGRVIDIEDEEGLKELFFLDEAGRWKWDGPPSLIADGIAIAMNQAEGREKAVPS